MVFSSILRLLNRLRLPDDNTKHEPNQLDLVDDDQPPSSETEHCTILSLPNEILLFIVAELDLSSKALLFLTCKRMHHLFVPKLDLQFESRMQKVNFLRVLERDHPDLLTCRFCACMYPWKERKPSYFCLHELRHSPKDCTISRILSLRENDGHSRCLTHDLVDLIFRAHKHGPAYGVPISIVDTTSKSSQPGPFYDNVDRYHAARMIDGQLLIYTSWQTDISSLEDAQTKLHPFWLAFCPHFAPRFFPNPSQTLARTHPWQVIAQALPNPLIAQEIPIFKCAYCMTDAMLYVVELPGGMWQVTLKVWLSFPSHDRGQQEPFHEQIFHTQPKIKGDEDEVLGRNLEALFESRNCST